MPDRDRPRRIGPFAISPYLGQAQVRWGRLSTSDYEGLSGIGALIALVAKRYCLSQNQASEEVERWLRDVGFGAAAASDGRARRARPLPFTRD